jgi:hypothetical protein
MCGMEEPCGYCKQNEHKMKKSITMMILFLLTVPIMAPGEIVSHDAEEPVHEYLQLMADRSLEIFLTDLAMKESSMVWDTINVIGAMGLWQFTENTLRTLGYDITAERFRTDPSCFPVETQREAMMKLLAWNERVLSDILDTTTNRAGVLAAAHLAGAYGVKNYFAAGHDARDRNGTSITDYLTHFNNHNYGDITLHHSGSRY